MVIYYFNQYYFKNFLFVVMAINWVEMVVFYYFNQIFFSLLDGAQLPSGSYIMPFCCSTTLWHINCMNAPSTIFICFPLGYRIKIGCPKNKVSKKLLIGCSKSTCDYNISRLQFSCGDKIS
jgi:hypothetical protein